MRLVALTRLVAGVRLGAQPRTEGAGRLPGELGQLVLALLPPPLLVATRTDARQATIWRGHRGEGGQSELEVAQVLNHTSDIADLELFPDGDRVVLAGTDGMCAIHDAWTGDVLRTFTAGGGRAVTEVRVFPGGDRLVALRPGSATIFDAASGTTVRHLDFGALASGHKVMELVPGTELLVTGVTDIVATPVVIWSTLDGRALHVLSHSGDAVTSLAVSPCGRKLATATASSVHVWTTASGTFERALLGPPNTSRWVDQHRPQVVITGGGARVVCINLRRINVWNGLTGELLFTHSSMGTFWKAALLPHHERLLVFGARGVEVLDLDSAGESMYWPGGYLPAGVSEVAFSAGGDVVAACVDTWRARAGFLYEYSGSVDHSRQISTAVWEVPSGRLLRAVQGPWMDMGGAGHTARPCSVAVWEAAW